MSVNRRPLGDATYRANNTFANVDHQYNTAAGENIASSSRNKPTRGSSSPVLATKSSIADHRGGRPPATAIVPEPVPANPRLSAIAQDARDADSRRVSQFSNASSHASSARQHKTHIGPWQLGKTLGKGSQARVRLARHRVSAQLVAIKIVAKSTAHLTQASSLANLDWIDNRKPNTSSDAGLRRMPLAIEREVAILKLIQHPNIIQLLDIWENRAEIYLVTEYIEKGDLFEFINHNGAVDEVEAIFYFRQMMSALEYCHSLNICHRDLKPENILLKGSGQIKIADFGMAALQQDPSHQLRTACGSPHYAAPELLRHQHYKGSAVDIWSMGVILFAMLAGRLPFDDDDMNVMLTKAKRAQYMMPKHLSREAEDLIRRILVVNPSQRITMKQMWKHPLIKKYDYVEEYYEWGAASRDMLRNADMEPIDDGDVDIQILRQLKSLWHSYTETELKGKLAQEKANDQKVFYWLLYNHRETQLENYNNDVPISKSDFHHLKPPNWGKRISTCKFTQAGRNGHVKSVSKFTVISNVTDQDEVGTVKSYDPYNSSQILQPCASQVSHARIVVHRNNSEQALRSAPTNVSHSYHTYHSVDGSLRTRSRMNSQRTSTTSQLHSPRGSMGSIRSHPGSPRKVRVNPRTKRGVDFSNVRNKDRRRTRSPARQEKSKVEDSEKRQQVVETEKEKPKDESQHWNEELQQLGHHVASYCDEAFGNLPGESPASSLYSLSFGNILSQFPLPPTPAPNRPLPPIPVRETGGRSAQVAADKTRPLHREANYISLKSNRTMSVAERRAVSEPLYNHSGREARPLPSIYENSSGELGRDNVTRHTDVPGDLGPRTPAANKGMDYLTDAGNTIRIVNSPATMLAQGPVPIPAPLNIRKISRDTPKASEAAPASSQDARRRASEGTAYRDHGLDGQNTGPQGVEKKPRVSSWFKRSSKEGASGSSFVTVTEDSARTDEAMSNPNVERKKKGFSFPFWKSATKDKPKMSLADPDYDDMFDVEYEEPIQRPKTGKPGASVSTDTGIRTWSENEAAAGRKIEVQQNWLARLFRVKPATGYLCFGIQRRRARQEMAILLRTWRKYGIKDVEVDKERNVIFGRVGARNHLNLKEVAFAIELMTVIEHGKRNHLSIARFTQEKGAASSFHKVVDEISSQFSRRGLLVAEKRKVNMMIKTLNS